jgi:hypothetical protein
MVGSRVKNWNSMPPTMEEQTGFLFDLQSEALKHELTFDNSLACQPL